MADNNARSLTDHLDDSLRGQESPEMQQRISNDPELAQEWLAIRMAAEAVKGAGLYEQVKAVKAIWLANQAVAANPETAIVQPYFIGNQAGFVNPQHDPNTEITSSGKVRTLYLKAMRVAAMVLILAGGAVIFKYITTSSSSLYRKYYASYDLNTSRGAGAPDAMEDAYDHKNWAAVITLFDAAKEKNNKIYFLTGMADLELKKYDDAIDKFQQVIAANMQAGTDYFQDEADYYLAMSWLARNDANEAYPLLEKIKSNKHHLYFEKVAKMSFTDLRIAQYKNHK